MTKIRIASDLHLEFLKYRASNQDPRRSLHNDQTLFEVMDDESEQILLLAGDIFCCGESFKQWTPFFEQLSKRFKHVYTVMGNHEHYRHDFLETRYVIDTYFDQFDNITLLNNDYVILDDDTALFGSTMWTNMNNSDSVAMHYARCAMNDFRIIDYGISYEGFTPEQSVDEFQKTIEALGEFDKLPQKNKVVMTHHAPSYQSVSEKYEGSPINPAFVSDLDEFITKKNYSLWIHGHVHNSSDYTIGKTRIIANPKGYGDENKHGYNKKLVVDFSDN